MFNKGKVVSHGDVALYHMPSLEEDRKIKSKHEIMQDIEDIQRKAYEEGFTTGEKAGLEAGEQKAAVLIDRLDRLLEEIAVFREDMVEKMEEQVVELAIAMARKIITEEITTRPEVIVSVVREALKRLQRMGTIMIKINPALHDLFMKKKSELIDIHKDITFDVNANVSLTGPLVISHAEEVVTDINALIENIMEDVRNVRAQKCKAGAQPGRTMERTVTVRPETCGGNADRTGQQGCQAPHDNETGGEAVQS